MTTVVGLLHLKLAIPLAMSLKDKRRAVKGFKDRLAANHNVSVAEVDGLNDRRSAVLAVAMVSNDKRYVEGALQVIINAASTHRDMILLDRQIEWV
jgi:hypothetical protein